MHMLMLLTNFVSFGVIETVVVVLAYVGIVMTLAKGNYKVLTIGLMLRTIDYLISFAKPIFRGNLRFSELFMKGWIFYGISYHNRNVQESL